jgi:acetyltransferase-like isoleucine patch superfamily enzyme
MITGAKRHTYSGTVSERFDPVVEIGDFCSIAGGLILYGSCEHPQTVSTYPFFDKQWSKNYPRTFSKGKIVIGNDVWIGEDVRILDGVTIGDGAVIGTGAVVAKDIPPYAVVVGNPAQIMKYRFTPNQIASLLKIKWWEWEDEKIKAELPYFTDIEKFIERNI